MRQQRSRKQTFISTAIILFFAMCVFQPLGGNREDWPFTFFGMYKARMYPQDVFRVDVDAVLPSGEIRSAFDASGNHYYVTENMARVLNGWDISKNNTLVSQPGDLRQDPESMAKVRELVARDVMPYFKKLDLIQPENKVRVRYRYWKRFSYDARKTADIDVSVVEIPMSQAGNP